ncbi:MAG: hypothetical protein ABW026_11050 [Microvirga sp.]
MTGSHSWIDFIKARIPPGRGSGSTKKAWIEFSQLLAAVIDDQESKITWMMRDIEEMSARHSKAIVDLQKGTSAKGGRAPLPGETVGLIEEALKAGQSTRKIETRFKVSPKTVSRVRKAMKDREPEST